MLRVLRVLRKLSLLRRAKVGGERLKLAADKKIKAGTSGMQAQNWYAVLRKKYV